MIEWRPSLKELLQDFLHICRREKGLTDATLKGYTEAGNGWLRWFVADCDHEPTIEDWSESNARAYHAHERRRGIRQSTCRMRVACLRSWGNWLVEMGHAPLNPWLKIKTPVNETLRQPCPNQESMRAMFDACDRLPNPNRGKMFKAALALGSLGGLREFEIVAVRVADVHLDEAEPYVFVRAGKGRKARMQPIGMLAVAVLRAWLEVRPEVATDSLLILRGKKLGDRPFTAGALDDAIKKLTKVGKVTEHVTPQALRRFGATRVAQQEGASMADAQAFLDHSDPKTTARYLKRTRPLKSFVDGILPAPADPPKKPQKPDSERSDHEARPHHLRPVAMRRAPRKG